MIKVGHVELSKAHVLGFRFSPRIRGLADKRLYVLGKERDQPTLVLRWAISLRSVVSSLGNN